VNRLEYTFRRPQRHAHRLAEEVAISDRLLRMVIITLQLPHHFSQRRLSLPLSMNRASSSRQVAGRPRARRFGDGRGWHWHVPGLFSLATVPPDQTRPDRVRPGQLMEEKSQGDPSHADSCLAKELVVLFALLVAHRLYIQHVNHMNCCREEGRGGSERERGRGRQREAGC
jgi:hypothetical protein